MRPLSDDKLMPWGKHSGTKMSEVPAEYLLHLKYVKKIDPSDVLDYINDNEAKLKQLVNEQNSKVV